MDWWGYPANEQPAHNLLCWPGDHGDVPPRHGIPYPLCSQHILIDFLAFGTYQCCGSTTFWCGSGSGSEDPCLWLMGSGFGSGSCNFRHWPSRRQQKTKFLKKGFSAYYFLKIYLHHFSKIKSQKEVPKQYEFFSYYFCLMIEGSGSGSRRTKNIRIRRIQIRIRNTGTYI